MAEVLFYHLETRPLEAVMPLLLEKTLERGWRAVVEVGSRERADRWCRAKATRSLPLPDSPSISAGKAAEA